MFKKVLVANRGEISVRIIQTLQEMGITAVAVYSDSDRHAPHTRVADEAYRLEGLTPHESYLRADAIIEIAQAHGVDAIHPGYGFLSENADFAEHCLRAGITFIGPPPDVIRQMGDKTVAKTAMEQAGVPVLPGWTWTGDLDHQAAKRQAKEIGYPVLVKAAAGGGGKGMRLVQRESELVDALEAASREAGSAFGDGRVFLEKYIQQPRHVEFQIFGDAHHHAVHLFERECSIQRRHQKIVEETPSPALDSKLRRSMAEAAVRAAEALGYVGAGTVEFILDQDGRFFFLEVNTRLQVEHPVTEATLNRDLVRAQILVAAGQRLPFRQENLRASGHSIECRIYAEDPSRGFLPVVGRIAKFIPPVGPGIRIDSGVREGDEITTYYDPMLAKLTVWAETRTAAIDKMVWALRHFPILGLTTNIEFLTRVVDHPAFRRGETHTHFLEQHALGVAPEDPPPVEAYIAAVLSRATGPTATVRDLVSADAPHPDDRVSPWHSAGVWRNA